MPSPPPPHLAGERRGTQPTPWKHSQVLGPAEMSPGGNSAASLTTVPWEFSTSQQRGCTSATGDYTSSFFPKGKKEESNRVDVHGGVISPPQTAVVIAISRLPQPGLHASHPTRGLTAAVPELNAPGSKVGGDQRGLNFSLRRQDGEQGP